MANTSDPEGRGRPTQESLLNLPRSMKRLSLAHNGSAPTTQVEHLWSRLKEWRAIATRYEKTANCFMGVLCLAAAID